MRQAEFILFLDSGRWQHEKYATAIVAIPSSAKKSEHGKGGVRVRGSADILSTVLVSNSFRPVLSLGREAAASVAGRVPSPPPPQPGLACWVLVLVRVRVLFLAVVALPPLSPIFHSCLPLSPPEEGWTDLTAAF